MSYIVTGLDIGSSRIRGLVVEQRKKGVASVLSVFQSPIEGMRRGMIVDVSAVTSALRSVAADLRKVSKHATRNVFVNLGGEHVKTRISRAIVAVARADQEIQEEDVSRVIESAQSMKRFPNHTVLHSITREFIVDDVGDIQNPVGMTGSRLEASVFFVEAFTPQLELFVKTLRRAGLQIGGVIYNPLAASRAVLSRRQKELGVLLLDMGFGTTSLTAYSEGKICLARTIPIGSGYITNDIAVGLKTSVDIAEKLKVSHGYAGLQDSSRRGNIELGEIVEGAEGAVSKKFLSEIIDVRVSEILDLVREDLRLLEPGVQLPAGVVAVGGGVKLAGFVGLLREHLRLSADIGFPLLSQFDIVNPTNRDLLDDPEFATVIGLAEQGLEEAGNGDSGFGFGAVKSFFRNLIP